MKLDLSRRRRGLLLFMWFAALMMGGCGTQDNQDSLWQEVEDIASGPQDVATGLPSDNAEEEEREPTVCRDCFSQDVEPEEKGEDLADADPCATVSCPVGAHCVDGQCQCDDGLISDGQGACVAPPACTPGSCGDLAWCNQGSQQCVCKPGFKQAGQTCVAPSPTSPALRTKEEVCTHYQLEIVENAEQQMMGGDADQCMSGEATRAALNDGLRRLNLYRWLAGLQPAWDVADTNVGEQDCALMQYLHGALSHNPTQDWACYTQAGAGAAGSSNLAMGIYSIAASVDLYIEDPGVASLGHRRWCLSPNLGHTAFGFFGSASCMYSFGTGNTYVPDYVAWPSPGYFPKTMNTSVWSFSSASCSWNSETTGKVTVLETGQSHALELESAGGNYGGGSTLRITPAAGFGSFTILAGDVQVTLYGLKCGGQPTDLTYTVKLVDCGW